MSWTFSLCQNTYSRKDSMQRHMNSKHSSVSLTQVQTMPTFRQKCLQFRFQHPFTSAISGMTGSGKTFWVQSLLQQSSQAIQLPPERIVWSYSKWQPAYLEMLSTVPQIGFVKGIPPALEDDFFFHVGKRNLIMLDDQMIDASKDKHIRAIYTRKNKTRLT